MRSWQMWAGAAAVAAVGLLAAMNVRPLRWRLSAPYYRAHYERIGDPVQRATTVDVLGRRGLWVYVPVLERAAHDPDPMVRVYAQQHLAQRGGRNSIIDAHEDLDALACRERFAPGRFFPLWHGDLTSGYTFGEAYWSAPSDCPTTAAQWQDYLAQNPDLVWLNVARWHAAPVLYQSGDRDGALQVLDSALRHPIDDGFSWSIQATLRYFVVEAATEADIDRWLAQGDWHPATAYALRYAKGLHAFRDLRFGEAAGVWEDISGWQATLSAGVDVYHPRSAPYVYDARGRGWPAERAALARQFAAADDLPVALLEAQLATRRGLFEAWLIVDNDVNHPMVTALAPLLGDSPRDQMLLAQAHHAELRIPHSTTWQERDLDAFHQAGAVEHYTKVAASAAPYAAQAAFMAGILSENHDDALSAFPFPSSPWAEHARFWSAHIDDLGETVWGYAPRQVLDAAPPSLAGFPLAGPLPNE